MTSDSEILALRSRINEVETRLEFPYNHLGIKYSVNLETVNQPVIDTLRLGNKIEAIKIHREIFNVDPAEAKRAADGVESRLEF